MSFDPTGERLITGGTDAITRMWRVDGMKELWKHKAHARTLYASAFHPTGKLAATSDAAGRVCIYDVLGLAFRSDGKVLATGGKDKLVRLWKVRVATPGKFR